MSVYNPQDLQERTEGGEGLDREETTAYLCADSVDEAGKAPPQSRSEQPGTSGISAQLPVEHIEPAACVLMPMEIDASSSEKKSRRSVSPKQELAAWTVNTDPPTLDTWDHLCQYVAKSVAPSLSLCPEWRKVVDFMRDCQSVSSPLRAKTTRVGGEIWASFTNLFLSASNGDLCDSERGLLHWEYVKPFVLANAGPWFAALAAADKAGGIADCSVTPPVPTTERNEVVELCFARGLPFEGARHGAAFGQVLLENWHKRLLMSLTSLNTKLPVLSDTCDAANDS